MSTRGLFELTTLVTSIGPVETRIVDFIHGSGCTGLDWIRDDLSFDLLSRHFWVMDSGASYEYYCVLADGESLMILTSLSPCTAKSKLMQRKNNWPRDRGASTYLDQMTGSTLQC